eukprot:gene2477-18139_t
MEPPENKMRVQVLENSRGMCPTISRNIDRVDYQAFFYKKAVENANEVGIREASRLLGIPRRNLQRWSKQTEELKSAALTPGITVRSQRRIRQSNAKCPLIESALLDYIKEERGKRNSVTGKQIHRKAMVIFPAMYLSNNERFSASCGWLLRMIRRNNLKFRRVTSGGQKIPDDAPERCDTFLALIKTLDDFDIIMNMDETPCYFDMPSSTTFYLKGVKTVNIRNTGNEKLRFTTVLTAGVRKIDDYYEGISLPLMVIFKNLTKALGFCQISLGRCALVFQEFIDTHINKPFKDVLKERWGEWIACGTEEFTKQGNRRRASYEMLCQWVLQAWKAVSKPAFIVSGFKQCGYIEWDDDYHKLHSRFRDTILNRAVPLEAILEVNEMLLELGEASKDVYNEIYEDRDHCNTVDENENENEGSGSDEEHDEDIIWSSGNPTIVARRYAGTLIKLDLQAYRRGKKKESCLLLKMTGTRYYPLTFPVEQSSQGLVSTTTLQSSHYRLSSSESIPHSRNFQLTKTLSVTDTPKLSSIISQSSGASATTSAIERRSTQTVMTTPMSLTGVSQVKVTMSSSVHRMTTRSVSQPSVNPKTQSSSTEAPTSALRTPTSVLSTNSILRSYSSKFLPISSKISPSLAVMQSPSSFAKSLETSFLKLQTDTSYGEQNTVHTTKVPVHSMFLSSVGIQIPGVGAAAQKRSNKETVMIGATISAAIETLKLGLTSNSFTNHSTNDGSIDGGSLKKNIGNPLYQDHLRLRTESANDRPPAAVYEDEYLVPSEPVYREIIEDGPIYSETGGIYQPIDENNVGLSESYQPLDSATLTRQNAPGCTTAHQAPIYHCLEEGYAPPKDAAQPPIYLTLEQESRQKPLLSEPVYQELECGHGSVNVVYEEEQV